MCGEVLDQVPGPLECEGLLLCRGLLDVTLLVREIVLTVVLRPAGTAERVPLAIVLSTPVELLYGLPHR
jgi:hypothetical protein